MHPERRTGSINHPAGQPARARGIRFQACNPALNTGIKPAIADRSYPMGAKPPRRMRMRATVRFAWIQIKASAIMTIPTTLTPQQAGRTQGQPAR